MKRSFLARLHLGRREAGRQTPAQQELRQALLSSGLFDSEHYRAVYPDVDKAGIDPLTHYLSRGHSEGRSPSENFDPAAYLAINPDVAKAGFEPLTHYVLHGQAEGRTYLRRREAGQLTASQQELRQALLSSGLFDPAAYLAINPDVAKAGLEPLTHYVLHGQAEGRTLPTIGFSRRLARREQQKGHDYFCRFGFLFQNMIPAANPVAEAVSDLAGRTPSLSLNDGHPEVSIIIPIYGQLHFVLNCLDSLCTHASRFSTEIIVMDDASPPETLVENLKAVPWIRYLRRSQNGGFITTCNDAASIARGRYLVFLNSDTRVAEGWLDELVGSFSLFPKAGLVGSKLHNQDGSLQEAGGIYWQDGSAWNYGRGQDPDDPKYSFARRVDYCSGAAIALMREAWDDAGGFDTSYSPAYCEDADIAFQLRKAGYEVWFQPLACVLHYEGCSHGRDTDSGIKAYQVSNMRKLADRWREVLTSHAPNGQNPDRESNRTMRTRILVVDAETPTPDRDAGSVITFHMMRALQQNGLQVSFVPHPSCGHNGRYTEALQRLGVECFYSPYVKRFSEILDSHGDFDYVLAYRHGVLYDIFREVRRRLPLAPIIFDNVDLHYLREEREAELKGDRRGRVLAAKTKTVELELISEVDCTIVRTSTEHAIIRGQVPVKNIVEFPYVAEIHPTQVNFDSRRDIMFLGSFRHPPNVDAMQYFVNTIWPLVQGRLSHDARLLIVGSDPPPSIQNLVNDRITVTGYVEDLTGYFDAARVFIAPLRYGAGIKGKVVQSLAYGTPAVVSPIAAEGIGLTAGLEVLIAEEPVDFADKIARLYVDQRLWRGLQQAGYDFVNQNFSWKRWLDLSVQVLETADTSWIASRDRALRRRIAQLFDEKDHLAEAIDLKREKQIRFE